MPLLITELAINADGQWAVEITNTGPDAIAFDGTTSFTLLAYSQSGNNVNLSLSNFAASIAAGETIVLGHSAITGVDNGNDFRFSHDNLSYLQLATDDVIDGRPVSASLDTIGVRSGPILPDDTVWTSDTSRTTDPDPDNLGDFTQTSPFSTNTLGTPTLSCFLAGTAIASPSGPRAVETLAPGDMVLTADGRAVPVVWLGILTLRRVTADTPHPIRIAAGALGHGLPLRALRLTADHALLLDGLLVNAGALVNGTTIRPDPVAAPFAVYHVETEAHEVLLAEGAPAESFINYAGRNPFDNHTADPRRGQGHVIAELNLPRVTTARAVPAPLQDRLRGVAPGRDAA
ncbi:Hint domain-containing protein [Roseicyclus mahoneyensis]|uniref:Hint domain-containing protein n=1 Tax=Roseicyclus mahoneyensis TaxID=164332 RepID=A0A316GN03_9RHOB|nr:Hint domain-containing protein [Roseicyclus mahoneyensis]PWK60813.1 Hint domain-containing protein [Roseicyclus mahoneyensis]